MSDNLVMEYENLIYSIAHYFEGYSSKEDLFQVGFIGLIKAYNKFDPNMNTKFSSYAFSYILGEMKKYIREDKGIKISRDITKLYLKIEKANILLSQQLMREPTTYELSKFLDIPEGYVIEAIKSINVLESIDKPIITDGKEMTLHDTIGEKRKVDIDTLIALKQELSSLSNDEYELIKARYIKDLTQTETAKLLGMSQIQVSRGEQKVLVKLKDRLVA